MFAIARTQYNQIKYALFDHLFFEIDFHLFFSKLGLNANLINNLYIQMNFE